MATPTPSKKRPTPRTTPVKSGRPAGLFTWLAVGLVVVVVAALVIIKVATGGSTSTGTNAFQPVDPTTFNDLTHVPASVFNAVGVTSHIAQISPPIKVKGQPLLEATNAQGVKVPEILYIGAEYCPFCAAQRWTTIIALSRFGTWSGLGDMSSYSGDVYPNTPTFTFVHASYKSKYIVFKSDEEYTNYIDPTTNYYALLQKPTAQESFLIQKYDTHKYIPYLTPTQAGSIPFITYANKFLVAGASYSPTTLAGSTRSQIAAGLSSAQSPITQAIIASANYQTAAICTLTNQQPASVCTSDGVTTAAKAMKLS